MRFVRTAIIAGIASVALAGAAFAAKDSGKMMLVALPDGSVQHIRYEGDVAPQVTFVRAADPAIMFAAAFGPDSVFAEMDRMAAAMEARTTAMLRQASTMQAQRPAANGPGIVMTNARGEPVGVMHYSFVSSSTDASGCTRTVSYSSDDAKTVRDAEQPKLIRTSSGSCGYEAAPALSRPVTPTAARPAAKPAPRIVPVSAPKPEEIFTPSRT